MTLQKSKSAGQSHGQNFHECADCGSTNPQWASLNHGVLICDECCLAHRSLGRCISIIKSLRKSYWPQSLIDTLYDLVRCNSNQIWESNLNPHSESSSFGGKLSSSSFKHAKKPSAKDSHANRLSYIKMKYENLAFLMRGKHSSIEDLNQQLFNSVKTNAYDTTLRILSQGADANYKSQEDGYTCMHKAVLSNQIGQIELLCLYGADVTALDRNGNTPYELARVNNLHVIAERLLELQFELTDELSYYLCNKRPEHKSGQHFLIPDPTENLPIQDESSKDSNSRLQELKDHLFEEVAKDVYDEVDRRQLESIWKCTVPQSLVNEPIPFLVIKSCFSQTRNQLRQKLARFSLIEFSGLVLDILTESKRRFSLLESPNKKSASLPREIGTVREELEDDDPLYDKVPSDEDYASVASEPESTKKTKSYKKENGKVPTTPKHSKNGNHAPLNVNTANVASPAKSKTPNSKNLASPSTKFSSIKEHKVLTTNFDKPPSNLNMNAKESVNQASLVANAESTLISIMNSLNQIDYSHLQNTSPSANSPQSQVTSHKDMASTTSNDATIKSDWNSSKAFNFEEYKSEKDMMQSLIQRLMEENAQLRAERMMYASGNSNNFNASHLNFNNYAGDEINLYSTVKNKKPDSPTNHSINISNELHHHHQNPPPPGHFEKPESSFLSSRNDEQFYDNSSYSALKPVTMSKNKLGINEGKGNEENDYENSTYYQQSLLNSSMNSSLCNEAKSILKIVEEHIDQNGHTTEKYFELQSQLTSMSSKSVGTNGHHKPETSLSNISSQFKTTNVPLVKHSPSKSVSSPSKTNLGENVCVPLSSIQSMPTKDIVMKKMRKITKTVQDLFKATKEPNFSSFKSLCEKVSHAVYEFIVLFPERLNSEKIAENLGMLRETCKSLNELVVKYQHQIEMFNSCGGDNEASGTNHEELMKTITGTMSTSSSSSSAISSAGSASEAVANQGPCANLSSTQSGASNQTELSMVKGMIVGNIVTYSYDIVYMVKRVVCAMDDAAAAADHHQ